MEPDLDELRRARMRRLDPTNNSAAPPPPPPPAEDAVSRDDPPSQQTTISTLLPSFGGQTPVVFCVTFEGTLNFLPNAATLIVDTSSWDLIGYTALVTIFLFFCPALASFFRQHQTGNALQTAHPSPSSVTVTEIAPEPAEPKVASHSEGTETVTHRGL